jgi:mRNA interferase RelE/StbE
MVWTVEYHPAVKRDLIGLGRVEAAAILKVIDERIIHGEPDKAGKPLSGQLAGCRRTRTGQTRIVYRVNGDRVEVLIIAVGMRRDNEIYDAATSRVE